MKTLLQITEFFSSDKICREYLERMKGKIICPHCDSKKIYRYKDGKLFKCGKCRKQFTIKVGTIFESSHISLKKWFWAIFLFSSHKKGISSIQLSKDIGVQQKTAWFMLQRIRYMMNDSEFQKPLENTVEADETYIGGLSKNMHKAKREKMKKGTGVINMTGVFGMLERKGKIKTEMIPEAKKHIIEPIIKDNINPEATLITDGLRIYNKLHKKHEVVNHEGGEYVRGKYHINTIEGYFSLLKRAINGIYHHASPKHLQRYCDAMSFRYNTRKLTEKERFNRLLGQCKGRLMYKELISGK